MTLSFAPEVFERLEPTLYLERCIEANVRPSGERQFEQAREQVVVQGVLESGVGSAMVRMGGTTAVCSISLGVSESVHGGGIYPNVEIVRGGIRGLPSQEEMALSQKLYQLAASSDVAVECDPRFRIFKDQDMPDKWLVVKASIQVLSRSGPCLDVAWASLVEALKSARVHEFVWDADSAQVVSDPDSEPRPLLKVLEASHDKFVSRSFGVVSHGGANVVLADLDGATEEAAVTTTINVVSSAGVMRSFSLHGDSSVKVTKGTIEKVLDLAS